jgi:hypothetical protein
MTARHGCHPEAGRTGREHRRLPRLQGDDTPEPLPSQLPGAPGLGDDERALRELLGDLRIEVVTVVV